MKPERADSNAYQSALGIGLVLFFVATSVTMAQYTIPTIMTEIMWLYGVGAEMTSWLMSIFTLVGILVAVPAGYLARSLGSRRVIVIAIVVNVIGQLMGAFAASIAFLLFTRALEGISLVLVITCAPLVIQRTVDPHRVGISTGVYMLGGMLGATFGSVLTPILFSGVGLRGLWVCFAAISALSGLVFCLYVKSPPMTHIESARTAGGYRKRGWKMFASGNILLFFIAFAVFQISLLTVLAYAPMSLQQKGMSAAMSGIVSTLPMLLAVVSSVSFGVIADKTGRCKPLCVIGMLVLGPCCCVVLNGDGVGLWAAVVLMGLLAMGAPTVFVAAYPSVVGDAESLPVALGVLLLVQSLGQFLGTLVLSVLLGASLDNWHLCGAVIMALALAGTACIALCRFR